METREKLTLVEFEGMSFSKNHYHPPPSSQTPYPNSGLLYSCEVVKKLTQALIEILKRANLLKNGIYIEVFLFKFYDFNSIENLSLVLLWNYIYKLKFDIERYSAIKF